MDKWTPTPNIAEERNDPTSTTGSTSTGPNHRHERRRLTCRDWQEKTRSGSMQLVQELHWMGVSVRKHSDPGNQNFPSPSINGLEKKRMDTESHGVVRDATHPSGANAGLEDPMSHHVQQDRANMQHEEQSNKSTGVQQARQGKRASFNASRRCLPLYSTISRRA